MKKTSFCQLYYLAASLMLLPLAAPLQAAPAPTAANWLDFWNFNNTNYWTYYGFTPVSATNLGTSILGDGPAVVIDSTNAAWLQYNVTEASGSNHLRVDQGTVMFWFAPNWSGTNAGGTGPGQWGRLLETGSYTTNASYGWWSLYLDADGANIFFGSQTNNGTGAVYLSAPIVWTTNHWHFIVLTYSATNSTLYLDGVLATNGPGVTYLPSQNVLSNGFWIGSDSYGITQAHGMFDDLATYNYPLDSNTISGAFTFNTIYYNLNPANFANLVSGPSTPSTSPGYYDAITGPGSLQLVGTASTCTTSNSIWITNVVATVLTNGSINVTFTIEGGSNGVPYDVFANSALVFGTNAAPWGWMGQGYHCNTYMLTNLSTIATNIQNNGVFLILGKPTDSDLDGLTDAYEQLVSKTDPHSSDTDGDGLSDAWEVLLGLNPLFNDNATTGSRANYLYNLNDELTGVTDAKTGSVTHENSGNVKIVSQ